MLVSVTPWVLVITMVLVLVTGITTVELAEMVVLKVTGQVVVVMTSVVW
jgi:hypothetical protein